MDCAHWSQTDCQTLRPYNPGWLQPSKCRRWTRAHPIARQQLSAPPSRAVSRRLAFPSLPGWHLRVPLLNGLSSRVQKQSRMFNEELRVLVVRAVIGVGVDDQLRIRHVLLHDERVHRGYVYVVAAVHDQGWLLDRLQIVGGPLLLDAPIANRFDLGGRHLVVHLGIAALLPTMRALQVLPSRRLARCGRTEFDREPDTLGRIVGVGTKEPPCSLGYQLHSLTAARTCAIDDQPANEIGCLQSDFLHDHAADREAK